MAPNPLADRIRDSIRPFVEGMDQDGLEREILRLVFDGRLRLGVHVDENVFLAVFVDLVAESTPEVRAYWIAPCNCDGHLN